MSLVEPVDLSISPKTLETIIDPEKKDFDKISPHITLKIGDVLFTSAMLVFQK